MTFQSFLQSHDVNEVSKNTGIPQQTLYDLRKGRYQNIKFRTIRPLLEEMLKNGHTEIELFNMLMKEK